MPRKEYRFYFLILIASNILCYISSINHGFTYLDDYVQVVENPFIKSVTFSNLSTVFSSSVVGMYQPITSSFFALITVLFSTDAIYFHSASLLFHTMNTLLVFKVLEQFFVQKKLILLLSLLFALHPMQVESVAWVSAFSTLTFTFFTLLAFLNYSSYHREKKQLSYVSSLIFFILACLSKSAAVIFPILLILFDYYKNKETSLDWKNKIPFFLVSILFGIITLSTRESAGHLSDLSVQFTWFDRIFLICHSILFYPLTFWLPFKLSAFYPYPELINGQLPMRYYISPIVLGGLLYSMIRFRNVSNVWFGGLWFLIGIGLVLQIVPFGNQITTDRYIYLPMLGLFIITGTWLRQFANKKWFLILFGIPLLFGLMSFQRSSIWENDEKLWNSVLEEYPNISQAYNNLGSYALQNKQTQKAIRYFDKAIQLQPNYADAYSNRGNIYSQIGETNKAIADYSKAISLKEHADAYFNRANEFSKLNDLNSAIADYTKSIQIKAKADTYTNRALSYLKMSKPRLAEKDLNKAIQLNTNYDRAYFLYGLMLQRQNQLEKACTYFTKAASLGNNNAKTALTQSCN